MPEVRNRKTEVSLIMILIHGMKTISNQVNSNKSYYLRGKLFLGCRPAHLPALSRQAGVF